MNIGSYIAIYLPLFIILFVVVPEENRKLKIAYINVKKRRGVTIMNYELIKKYIGKNCWIYTIGTNVRGTITEINENWLEVKTKKGYQIVNIEFIQSIMEL